MCQVSNNLFEDQTYSFFLSVVQRVYIFEESPKSVQDVIGDAIVLASIVPTEGNANLLVVM